MRRPPGDLAAAGALMLVVLVLWVAVRTGRLLTVDAAGLVASGRLIPVWIAADVTRAGDTLVRFAIAGIAAALLWWAGRGRAALFLLLTVAGGTLFNELLKQLADRDRPDLLPSVGQAHGTSFPSGHSAGAAVLFGALALVVPRRWRRAAIVVATVSAIAVGVSRAVLAVHWPSDIVAGWAAGLAWLLVAHHLAQPTRASR